MEDSKEDEELVDSVDKLEKRIIQVLSKYEWRIVSFQSILVWEKPYHSAAFLGLVNFIFWMAANLPIYSLIGIVGAMVTALDMWSNKIWPEIRVDPAPGDNMDEWAPIFPKYVSIQEIANFVAVNATRGQRYIQMAAALRNSNYPLFYTKSVALLLMIYAFGSYVSFTFVIYVAVMTTLLYPFAHYHDLPNRVKARILPHLILFHKSFQTSKRLKKSKRRSLPVQMKSHEEDTDSDADLMPLVDSPERDAASTTSDELSSRISLDDDISINEMDRTEDSFALSRDEMPGFLDLDSTLNSTLNSTLDKHEDDTDNDCDSLESIDSKDTNSENVNSTRKDSSQDSEFEFLNKD